MAAPGNSMKRFVGSNRGLTLVELMIAILISFMVMGATYSFYRSQEKTAMVQQELAIVQQDLRAAMQMLTRDIRMAGYDPRTTRNFGIVRSDTFSNGSVTEPVSTTSTTFAATSDLDKDGTLDLAAEDVDGNGNIDLREVEQIAYRLDAANEELDKYSTTTGVIEWHAVAENIEAIEFYYQLNDMVTWTLTPTAAEMPRIRSVTVSVLAKAKARDPGYVNTTIYTAASGAKFNAAPYNDNFRRRLLIETIQCRNTVF